MRDRSTHGGPEGRFRILWHDAGREARCRPNPAHPQGIDVNAVVASDKPTCKVSLPYPARRVGAYEIECLVCGRRIGLTTAGRPDDPRSVTVNCKLGAKQ